MSLKLTHVIAQWQNVRSRSAELRKKLVVAQQERNPVTLYEAAADIAAFGRPKLLKQAASVIEGFTEHGMFRAEIAFYYARCLFAQGESAHYSLLGQKRQGSLLEAALGQLEIARSGFANEVHSGHDGYRALLSATQETAGEILLLLGKHKEAVSCFRAAVAIQTDNYLARLRLAQGLMMLAPEETAEADRILAEIDTLGGDEAHEMLAMVRGSVGMEYKRFSLALKYFKQAYALNQANPRHARDLARGHYRLGEYCLSVSYFLKYKYLSIIGMKN